MIKSIPCDTQEIAVASVLYDFTKVEDRTASDAYFKTIVSRMRTAE